ncbi:MAG TPA: hypothetical protein VMS82_14535 [Pseudolabrys sp.]|jgi:hypothetical protein|nr:hypothetical protein [Pseudolabrys sp.]
MTRLRLADFVFICATTTSLAAYAQGTEPHGWLNTETLKTRSCDFEFKNGYPVGDTAQRLLNLQKFNRAVEVYLTQLMAVSEIALREGMRAFGSKKPAQVVIWENLMDAQTVLLTANTETVYAMRHLDLD